MDRFDIAAVVVSLVSLSAYTLHFYLTTFRGSTFSNKVVIANNFENVFVWLVKHQEKIDAPSVTLAIQTIRNTILVAIFIGGQALVMGVTFVLNLEEHSSQRESVRRTILAILFISSFLCWASTIRAASHVGYLIGTLGYQLPETMIGIDAESGPATAQAGHTSALSDNDKKLAASEILMKDMFMSFSFGFRFLFFAVPFMFFVSGPIALVVATGVMLVFLFLWDRPRLVFGSESDDNKLH